jgi:hypothetical protein
MITISDLLLMQSSKGTVIWDLGSLGQFDHINPMITLSVIDYNKWLSLYYNQTFRVSIICNILDNIVMK